MYKATGTMIGTHFNLTFSINEAIVESIVNRIWCTDGKMWSTRIWNNKTLFQQRLMDGLVDMVGRGVSHDDVISRFREEFNVEYHKAQRLVRTELEYVQTQATLDSYIKAGVQWYNVLDAGDYPGSGESPERECIRCHEIAEKGPYECLKADAGVNLPPFHPDCRCVIIPVNSENKGFGKLLTNKKIDYMDAEEYNTLKALLESNGYTVTVASGDDERFIQWINAEALAGAKGIIHINDIPSASAFYEECVHLIQFELYGYPSSDDLVERNAFEIEANRHLLQNEKIYHYTEDDHNDIFTNLQKWEKDFFDRTGINYDESAISKTIPYNVWEYFGNKN